MRINDLPVMTPVVEKLLKMRQALIDQPEELFDMNHWKYDEDDGCGTAHCLLGSYVAKYGAETGMRFDACNGISKIGEEDSQYFDDEMDVVIEAIGISPVEAYQLFVPSLYDNEKNIHKSEVMERLDSLIEKYSTGELLMIT